MEKYLQDVLFFDVYGVGIKLCVNMIQELAQSQDVVGFHFYTLNLENSVMTILKDVQLLETVGARRYDSVYFL